MFIIRKNNEIARYAFGAGVVGGLGKSFKNRDECKAAVKEFLSNHKDPDALTVSEVDYVEWAQVMVFCPDGWKPARRKKRPGA